MGKPKRANEAQIEKEDSSEDNNYDSDGNYRRPREDVHVPGLSGKNNSQAG